MSKSHFPQEILTQILSNLSSSYDQGTLASCCIVSKALYRIATPILWKYVHLPSIEETKNSKDETHGQRDINANSARLCTAKLRKYTKFLHVDVHPRSWCSSACSNFPDLTDIQTVHLHLKSDRRLESNQRSIHTSDEGIHRVDQPSSICPLLNTVKPRNLIIRNASTRTLNLRIDDLPHGLYENVETLVFVSSSYEKYQPSPSASPIPLPDIPNLKRIYWIFDPTPLTEPSRTRSHREWYKLNISALVGLTLGLPEIPIKVVNIGSTILKDPNRRYLSIQKTQDDAQINFHEELGKRCRDELFCWCPTHLENRRTSIRFVSLEEFIGDENGRWEDWFDFAELGRWKKMMKVIR